MPGMECEQTPGGALWGAPGFKERILQRIPNMDFNNQLQQEAYERRRGCMQTSSLRHLNIRMSTVLQNL